MSLSKNIISNYASQFYVTLISIVMVPVYVRLMGAEAYGLVGFFAMLQAWFQLLDIGLTPTISRETARFNAGAISPTALRELLRTLEFIFFLIGGLGCMALLLCSDLIASKWLHAQSLPLSEVELALRLMFPIVALRWLGGLYRGVISGFERIVWLSAVNAGAATARFVIVLPVLFLLGATPETFFTFQLIISVAEVIVLISQAYRLLPSVPAASGLHFRIGAIRSTLRFSLSVAFTSSVWVLVTQTDKLALSKLLPLSTYAYFTVGVMAATGVSIVSGPISAALLPRLTRIAATKDDVALCNLYRSATQVVAVIAIPAAAVLAFFSQDLLWAWTNNVNLSHQAAPVLTLYAIGNGFLAVGAFPFYLQYAKGEMRLHLYGSLLFLVFLVPALVFAATRFGATGAGYAWGAANFAYFCIWVPIVHRRFFKGLHSVWLEKDVLPAAFSSIVVVAMLRFCLNVQSSRVGEIALLLVVGLLAMSAAVASSSSCRTLFLKKTGKLFFGTGQKEIS